MRPGEYITEYEVKLGTEVAEVLCGQRDLGHSDQ